MCFEDFCFIFVFIVAVSIVLLILLLLLLLADEAQNTSYMSCQPCVGAGAGEDAIWRSLCGRVAPVNMVFTLCNC